MGFDGFLEKLGADVNYIIKNHQNTPLIVW